MSSHTGIKIAAAAAAGIIYGGFILFKRVFKPSESEKHPIDNAVNAPVLVSCQQGDAINTSAPVICPETDCGSGIINGIGEITTNSSESLDIRTAENIYTKKTKIKVAQEDFLIEILTYFKNTGILEFIHIDRALANFKDMNNKPLSRKSPCYINIIYKNQNFHCILFDILHIGLIVGRGGSGIGAAFCLNGIPLQSVIWKKKATELREVKGRDGVSTEYQWMNDIMKNLAKKVGCTEYDSIITEVLKPKKAKKSKSKKRRRS